MSGAILIEGIFNVPGLGFTLFNGIRQQNGPVVVGISTLMVFIFLAINLLVDIVVRPARPEDQPCPGRAEAALAPAAGARRHAARAGLGAAPAPPVARRPGSCCPAAGAVWSSLVAAFPGRVRRLVRPRRPSRVRPGQQPAGPDLRPSVRLRHPGLRPLRQRDLRRRAPLGLHRRSSVTFGGGGDRGRARLLAGVLRRPGRRRRSPGPWTSSSASRCWSARSSC